MTKNVIAPWLTDTRWPTAPIRLVARLGSGHTPNRGNHEYWINCTEPWITLADVWQLRSGQISFIAETKERISPLGLANSSATLHPAGTVILSRTASVGFSAIMATKMATSQDFATWTCGPKLDPRYLLHALRGMTPDLKRVATGSTHKTIYMPDIEQLRIPLPSMEEQRRIAIFLDTETARIDELRALTGRQSRLLRDRFGEHMLQETTAGQGDTTKTGIPWMPETNKEWDLVKVSHAFRTSSGTTPTSNSVEYFNGPHPWVNSADLRDGLIDSTQKSVTQQALRDFSALKIQPAGALIVALYGQGATKGRVGILDMEACLNQACCALIPNGRVMADFAAYWFRAHKAGITAQAVGAGQPNLSQELIRQLKMPAPSPETQIRIVKDLRTAEDAYKTHVSLLDRRDVLLTERRQALITAAVTGQFDVSTASGRNVTDGVRA